MKGPMAAFVAGVVVGIVLAVLLRTLGLAVLGQPEFWRGAGYGFGAGFGAVFAFGVLNFLITYVDKLASGRA